MEWTVAIGVDTHKEVHVAVALDRFGAQLDSREVETTVSGYRSLLSWASELGVPAFAVEGCGSYGAGLVRFLEVAGVAVSECERVGCVNSVLPANQVIRDFRVRPRYRTPVEFALR